MDQRESVRARHAAELEAKRKKLEEIRRRKANIRDGEVAAAAPESVTRAIDEQENKFDDFIQNILKSSTTAVAASESDVAATQDPSSSAGATAGGGASATLSLAEKLAALSTVTSVAEVHIQPTLVETYNKHTETDITLEHELIVREYEAMTDVESTPRSPKKQAPESVASPSKQRALTLESESGDVAMELSEDEKKQIMQSDAMEAFLLKASRVIERAMTSAVKYDIMVDYGATVEEDLVTEEATETLKQLFTFRDDQWTRCRAVTDVDMSPFYPELMLVAYTARDFLDEEDKEHASTGAKQWDTMGTTNASAFSDLSRTTDGVVMLWSTALPTRPEYRFTCHSQVTSSCFNPFDRNIIFGGTYSGQIVVWDTRAKSAPVQKTSLSSGSHTHPIYSLAVVGTKSAYHLVSASTDGRVCVWDVDQLQQPLEMLDLRISMSIVSNYAAANISTDKKMEASVTTFAVHRKENRQLYIGTEAGKLYSTPLDAQKSKTTSSVTAATTDASSSLGLGGVDPLAIDKSILPRSAGVAANIAAREVVVTAFSKENTHFGPVTSMHLNPLLPVHRDGLLLTSSLDSTVKLWSTEHPHSPVFSFEPSTEYVCDVRWSPTHPALFAVVDGAGAISFWNIIKDIEVPALEAKIADKALNKVRWTSDGKNVIVGDASGSTIVYEVPVEVAQPQADDLSLLESKVASAVLAGGLGTS